MKNKESNEVTKNLISRLNELSPKTYDKFCKKYPNLKMPDEPLFYMYYTKIR